MNPKLGMLHEKTTAFFMCDLQEKFANVIEYWDVILKNSQKLVSQL